MSPPFGMYTRYGKSGDLIIGGNLTLRTSSWLLLSLVMRKSPWCKYVRTHWLAKEPQCGYVMALGDPPLPFAHKVSFSRQALPIGGVCQVSQEKPQGLRMARGRSSTVRWGGYSERRRGGYGCAHEPSSPSQVTRWVCWWRAAGGSLPPTPALCWGDPQDASVPWCTCYHSPVSEVTGMIPISPISVYFSFRYGGI